MTTLAIFTFMGAGGRITPGRAFLTLVILLAVYAVFSLAQRRLLRTSLLRAIGVQLNLLVLALLSMIFLTPFMNRLHPNIPSAISAAAVFLTVMAGLKLFDLIFFENMAPLRKKPPVPILLRDLGRWTVSLIALAIIVRSFLPGINLSVLAVSSLVAGYILGNATQDTLSHLVAGLALNTETPFRIGDWVTVGGHTGVVVDTTWRATTLRTKADDYIVIPNASIAREPIANYSRPTRCHGCYCNIGTDYGCPPNVVRATILSTLAGIPEVVTKPAPEVQLAGYGDFSVNFRLKFFIEDYAQLDPIQSLVMDRLWYAFKRAGISMPFPIRDVRTRDASADQRLEQESRRKAVLSLISGVTLFESLSPQEHESLADAVHTMPFASGEELCKQNQPGDSFYIINRGCVAVTVAGPDGKPVPVARLEHGAFFGEMSLLTGEARSATVTAETDVEVLVVSKADFSGLLRANSALAGKLAVVLEKRITERDGRITAAPDNLTAPVTHTAIADRIRRFFNLG